MIDVHWLEHISADLPADHDWLSGSEADHLRLLRFPKRRADWMLGRWTAKRGVSLYLNLPTDPQSLACVEILPASSGAPEVFCGNQPAPVTISISHREGRAACAVSRPPALLGCDLEIVEPRSDAFISDYFTAGERELVAQASVAGRRRLLALLWSAKESVLKALRVGLRIDTRLVAIEAFESCGSDWRPLRASHEGRIFHGWWRQTGRVVRTLVASPDPAPPAVFQAAMERPRSSFWKSQARA